MVAYLFFEIRLEEQRGSPTVCKKMQTALTIDDARAAAARLQPYIHPTPVITSQTFDQRTGCRLHFKCENLQKTGSFKIRGAINAVAQLDSEMLSRGVVTHSSGNHAAALAYAARLFRTTAHIVMPSNSSAIKKEAVKNYDGQIIECEPNLESRLSVAAEVQAQTGATMIPPFDHPHIIAGQATCALEFLQQVPQLDFMLAPIGGGGLMSGTCLAVKSLSPRTKIIGAEPAGADDAFQSKLQNRFIPQTNPQTIADGLRTSLGQLTWPFIRDWVDEIVTVEETEIIEAHRFFCERTKLLIEPSSAVTVAVALKLSATLPQSAKLGIVLSGGNMAMLN